MSTKAWREANRDKVKASKAANRKRNPDTQKAKRERYRQTDAFKRYITNKRFKERYGITWDDYWNMAAAQGNLCYICHKPETEKPRGSTEAKLSVDHNHNTSKVRKLLCLRCNRGIGCFNDDIELMARALAYLCEHMENKQ